MALPVTVPAAPAISYSVALALYWGERTVERTVEGTGVCEPDDSTLADVRAAARKRRSSSASFCIETYNIHTHCLAFALLGE